MALNAKKALLKAQSLARKGERQAASELYRRVLEAYPGNKQAARELKMLQQATSPSLPPEQQKLFEQNMLDLVRLYNAGHTHQALAQATQMVARHPDEPVLHNLLGAVHTELRDYRVAIDFYQRAIQLHPGYAEAYSNLGAACNKSGNQQAATEAYERALQLEPGMFEAHNNLGNVHRDCGRPADAIARYHKAIELKPDFADAFYNLGCALSDLGRFDEAAANCSRAAELRPGYSRALAKLAHLSAQTCDWDILQALSEQIPQLGLEGEAVIPFELLQLDDDPGRQLRRAQRYATQRFLVKPLPPLQAPDKRPERIRLGYFSGDFCEHATMHLMIRFFELQDRSRFEVHAFSSGADDTGPMRERLLAVVDGFHDIRSLSDLEAAELTRSLNIDIAIDLKGYTRDSRLGVLAYRPAPVQISYLGFPGTVGASFIDYIIGDAVVIPKGDEACFTEQIIRLPHSYQMTDNTRALPDNPPARADAGLPQDGFVFCCFNNNNKVGPAEFGIWMQLLQEITGSVLWLFKSNPLAEHNLRREAEKHNVDPDRLVFAEKLPQPEHLARQQLADLFLDTFNYNAHTTTSDALWAGLPVVTKAGASFPARVAASLLQAANQPGLITHSKQEYAALALELAQQPDKLQSIADELVQQRKQLALFDTEAISLHIQTAYERVFENYLAGENPTSFDIDRLT